MIQPPGVGASLADKLEYLFDAVRPDGEDRSYSQREIVARMTKAGYAMSNSHLSELCRGVKKNPTVEVIEGLASIFGVPAAYLLDYPPAVDEVEAELELRRAARDAEVVDIAFRAAGLQPAQRAALMRELARIIREHDDPK